MARRRQLTASKWNRWKSKNPLGAKVEGEVLADVTLGCIVQLQPTNAGVIGFLRWSAYERELAPEDRKSNRPIVGDIVSAYIESYDNNRMRAELSLKQRLRSEVSAFLSAVTPGQTIVGRVVGIAEHGAFLQIDNGCEAFIGRRHLPLQEGASVESVVELDDSVAASVIEKDPAKQRLRLSVNRFLDGEDCDVVDSDEPQIQEVKKLEEPSGESTTTCQPRKILVIEDDPEILDVLGSILRNRGHTVVSTSSLLDFEVAAMSAEYDVAIVDALINGKNILHDVIAFVTKSAHSLKVVVCTALYGEELLRDVVSKCENVLDILLKPVDINRLNELVSSLQRSSQFEAESFAIESEAEPPSVKRQDVETALQVHADAVHALWPNDNVLIAERGTESAVPKFVLSRGRLFKHDFEVARYELRFSPIGDVVNQGKAVIVPEPYMRRPAGVKRLRGIVKCQSMIGLPIRILDVVKYGVFVLREQGDLLADEDLEKLTILAMKCGVELDQLAVNAEIGRWHLRMSAANLLGGMTHETGNALYAIRLELGRLAGWTTFLRNGCLPGTQQKELADSLHVMSEKCSWIADTMKGLLQELSENANQESELAPLLDGVHRLIAPQARMRAIHTEYTIDSSVERMIVPTLPIRQTLFNIVLNAVQQLENCDKAEKRIVLAAGVDNSGELPVWIEVSDSGYGIHHHSKKRIFEAHYTTKPNGAGLGLYLAQSFVNGLGGRIDLESTIFKGSCFTIRLPRDVRSRRHTWH